VLDSGGRAREEASPQRAALTVMTRVVRPMRRPQRRAKTCARGDIVATGERLLATAACGVTVVAGEFHLALDC
jgi:hypothetical protein